MYQSERDSECLLLKAPSPDRGGGGASTGVREECGRRASRPGPETAAFTQTLRTGCTGKGLTGPPVE